MKTVIDVKEVDVTSTPANRRRMMLGWLLSERRFWSAMAADEPRLSVTLQGVLRNGRQIVQLVVTERLKPLPHEA